ncbi:C-8 sterol isomerase [Ephemerocybe angulata]|uniref:C-8 sterol isomerase n=1 Tax=Ephemerocybe angulata TaxID=980116 RepID=A0A8H6HUZ8_9AGAR|nr:C-8 sterol isomerase [Tulosesus angulatus]
MASSNRPSGGVPDIGRYLDNIKDNWYVFDPVRLHQLSQAAIAANPSNDTAGIIRYIVTNLTQTYPSTEVRLNLDVNEWMFNNAGGAMGAMYIIHASITEYLIIFGTPLGTEGHSGLHLADDYFNILVGEQWAFAPGALEKERYPPGSYARGWIPTMAPFGAMDALTSTLDFPTFFRTARITAREMLGNILIGKI